MRRAKSLQVSDPPFVGSSSGVSGGPGAWTCDPIGCAADEA